MIFRIFSCLVVYQGDTISHVAYLHFSANHCSSWLADLDILLEAVSDLSHPISLRIDRITPRCEWYSCPSALNIPVGKQKEIKIVRVYMEKRIGFTIIFTWIRPQTKWKYLGGTLKQLGQLIIEKCNKLR